MNFPVKLSLQKLSTVNIALHLYYNSDIQILLDEERKFRYVLFFDKGRYDHWILIEQLGISKLSSLPKPLRTEVVNLLRSIDTQVIDWKETFSYLEHLYGNISTKNTIIWKMDGTINREETAKIIVQNMNEDSNVRFIIACTFFMEEDIINLWHTYKGIVSRLKTNTAVIFWIKHLEDYSSMHWTEKIAEIFPRPVHRKYCHRVSCFLHFLPQRTKRWYLKFLHASSDDLQCCLHQMNELQCLELFQQDPGLLSCLLEWPLQVYFMDMANKLWTYINIRNFQTILFKLVVCCIFKSLRDFDYIQILKDFWHLSPVHLKIEFENDYLFPAVKAALNYNCDTEIMLLEEVMYNEMLSRWN